MAPALSKKAKIGIALTAIVLCKKEIRKREVWARQLYLERPKFTQMQLLAVLECDEIRNFLRMTPQIFNELLGMIRPYIEKRDTYMRKAAMFFLYDVLMFSSFFSSRIRLLLVWCFCTSLKEICRPRFLYPCCDTEGWPGPKGTYVVSNIQLLQSLHCYHFELSTFLEPHPFPCWQFKNTNTKETVARVKRGRKSCPDKSDCATHVPTEREKRWGIGPICLVGRSGPPDNPISEPQLFSRPTSLHTSRYRVQRRRARYRVR